MQKITFVLLYFTSLLNTYSQIHTSYLWHMHQPTYWGEQSLNNPNRYHTDGWYKYFFPSVTSLNLIFNNGNSGVDINQTEDILGVTSDIWYEWGVGLNNENILFSKIKIYPNPAKNIIYVNSSENFEQYILSDSFGRIIQKGSLEANQIKVTNNLNGVYILKLIIDDNRVIKKVIFKN